MRTAVNRMHKRIRHLLSLLSCWLLGAGAVAQPQSPAYTPLYDDAELLTVMITVDPDTLDWLYENVASDHEFRASVTIIGNGMYEVMDDVGFRLRGNTSRHAAKKSFKIAFNTFVPGRKLQGVEKLNLNGEHNDPSVIRSKLSWDLFQTLGLPAPRANHAKVYINGDYFGLYINVEHIDDNFLLSRFGDDSGNLYKCLYPADLTYRGPDARDYYPNASGRPYELKLKDDFAEGYDDLAHFIDRLNHTPDAVFADTLEALFDVNGFLRSLAVDVVTGSWDDYWFLQNNYYLYFDPAIQRFRYLPFDFDNTFGIDWFGIDWGQRDVYAWGHPSEARPLTSRILQVQTYRDRFSFYLRRTLDQAAHPDVLLPRLDTLYARIRQAAITDPYRPRDYGYTVQDFDDSYTQALRDHVTYGLQPFIEDRYASALVQLEEVNVRPILSEARLSPTLPSAADSLRFLVRVEDETPEVSVLLRYQLAGGPEETLVLLDDGLHHDRAAQDAYYGGVLPPFPISTTLPPAPASLTLTYWFEASDGRTTTTSPRTLTLSQAANGPLFLNEFMASNDATLADEAGEFDDWVELYNGSSESINLSGYFLTDNLARPDKWILPDTLLAPGGFLLIWADDDTEQGPLHAPYKLDKDGEQLGLYDPSGALQDSLTFGPQTTDVAFGRSADGSGSWGFMPTPTPEASNAGSTHRTPPAPLAAFSLRAFPNPFRTTATLEIRFTRPGPAHLEIFDALGRRLWYEQRNITRPAPHVVRWDGRTATGLVTPPGVYFLRVRQGAQARTHSLVRLP